MPAMVEPKWSDEPDHKAIRTVVRQALQFASAEDFTLSFLAEGAFNKVYRIRDVKQDKDYVLRLTLPVDPIHKIECEAATLMYLRAHTSLPVPQIYSVCSAAELSGNGFEYMIEEYMPGQPLVDYWHKLSKEQLANIVRQLAVFQAELYRQQFDIIGGLRRSSSSIFRPERVSTQKLFWYDRYKDPAYKGPFNSSKDWIQAILQHALNESRQLYDREQAELWGDEEDENSDFEGIIGNIECLLVNLTRILTDLGISDFEENKTTLYHPDLNVYNLLINPQTGRITGIIDWENVAAVPLWAACELPALLLPYEKVRDTKPERGDYEDMGRQSYNEETGSQAFDNEGKCPKYWNDLFVWRAHELRAVYLEEMTRLCPEWIDMHYKSEALRDFIDVLQCSDLTYMASSVWEWIQALADGERRSFIKVRLEKEPVRADEDSNDEKVVETDAETGDMDKMV